MQLNRATEGGLVEEPPAAGNCCDFSDRIAILTSSNFAVFRAT